ncbi:fasciclin domain-containing protein [Thalassococcus sp. S3]|uniref:fasciclin domain-containing protein n=1 Tax=Thalassococcus sp. S3 TaxID=2017482 RepID=UPI0010245605|nr:fasciclin domain-containing protein [Thalassococcus sp. S3]QBF30433.1 fasciclin [Thalassococcus sp. S3]
MERRTVLTLMGASAAAMALTACAQQEEGNDIVDIAAGSPDFSTLVAAIQAAGLEETLRGPGPFTVFAPVNSAFDALPAGTLESLLLPENRDQLANILTYHVVPGAITSDQILGQRLQVATVQGQSVDVNGIVGKFGSGVRVNDANVISADIIATNGVIHAIDQVLLPS